MFKLLKWAVIGTISIGAFGYFLFGDHLGSYFHTATNSFREGVRGQIPVEFEIKRAEKLVQAIDPEIKECKRDLARAEVELEHLVREVDRLGNKVARQEGKLKSGAQTLTTATAVSYEVRGRSYSRRRIELDLERTFEAYKNNKSLLKGKKMLIERQSRAVGAARAKLDAVRAERARLEHNIASLKAQKRNIDALAASSNSVHLDDTKLSQAKEALADVKKRLDVAQKMIEEDIFFTEGIGAESKPNRNIVKEINEHFSATPAPKQLTERGEVRRVATR